MKTIIENSVTSPNGKVIIKLMAHTGWGDTKTVYIIKAVENLRGLISEAKAYNVTEACDLHKEIMNAAIVGIDCHVPNDVKYHRTKTKA